MHRWMAAANVGRAVWGMSFKISRVSEGFARRFIIAPFPSMLARTEQPPVPGVVLLGSHEWLGAYGGIVSWQAGWIARTIRH